MSYRASCFNTNMGPTRQLTCAVPSEQWHTFDQIARRMDKCRAEIMREIVMKFIEENGCPTRRNAKAVGSSVKSSRPSRKEALPQPSASRFREVQGVLTREISTAL